VVWLDAHGDFNTTDTSACGSLDGMGLRILTGLGWDELRRTVPGLTPVAERDVVLVGARALEPAERGSLAASGVTVLPDANWSRAEAAGALDELSGRVRRVYLHVDLDVLDPSIGRANRYAQPGGLTTGQVLDVFGLVTDRFDIAAAAITAYDPDADTGGAVAAAAVTMLDAVGRLR
jgi:arginase